MIEKTLSTKYELNNYNYKRILKVLGWTFLAGGLTSTLNFIPQIDFPVQYSFAPAIINTLMYALLEFIQEQKTIK